MLKDTVAVIDIGSAKLTAIIGENGVNKNFVIRAISEEPHNAIFDGEIIDYNALTRAIINALDSVCQTARVKITQIYVGVGGEFLELSRRQHEMTFPRKKRINARILSEYYQTAVQNMSVPNYRLIDQSSTMFFIDGGMRVENPIGQATQSLKGYVCAFFAKEDFVSKVEAVLKSKGVKTVIFVPIPLAEAKFLFTLEERFAYVLLLDVGFMTSSFSIIHGGGVIYQKSFPVGGGFISGYFAERLNVDGEIAERIKRKLNLYLPSEYESVYEINYGDEIYSFSQKTCNEIAKSVLTEIAEQVDKALSSSHANLPKDIVISLTGGGISFIRGAKEFLFSQIEMPVNLVSPSVIYMSKPDESSKLSLLNYALNEK